MAGRLAAAVRRREDGATAVEYALLIALIAAGLFATLFAFSDNLSTTFEDLGPKISNYASNGTSASL
ncbi:MAG: Flp family type IVb pilin [Acidimicrobiales bacterium]